MKITMNKKGWRKFPWEKAAPYNKDDLIVFLSRNTAVVFKNIRSDTDNIHFSISQMMTHDSYKQIFACTDFQKTLKEFVGIMDSRLERFFITKKAEYVFFDEEEQKALKDIVSGLSLSSRIDILRRKKSTNNFEVFPLMFATKEEYQSIREKLISLGLEINLSLDEYMRIASKKNVMRGMSRDSRDSKIVEEILKDYPNFNVKTKDELKKAYRAYSKECHPDTHPDDANAQDKFAKLSKAYEDLQGTMWFQRLE